MKYTVFYSRKVRVAAYDMLEIALSMEFDGEHRSPESAFNLVKEQVEAWLERESDRLLEKSVPRPDVRDRK